MLRWQFVLAGACIAVIAAACTNELATSYQPRKVRTGDAAGTSGPSLRLRPDAGGTGSTPTVGGTSGGTTGGGGPSGSGGACAGLDYRGRCSGNVAQWCGDDLQVKERDCAARGQTCRYVDDVTGFYCVGSGSGGGDIPSGGGAGGAGGGAGGGAAAQGCGNPTENQELELTNQARQQGGAGALTCDDILTRAARAHSQDMCDQGYFSHTGRDGSDFSDRVQRAGGSIGAGGENIAWGQQTAQEVHETWMNSPGHHANIMNGGYGRIGIGYVDCGGSPYWTQVFSD